MIAPAFAALNSSTSSRITVVLESFPTQIDGQLIVISAEATVEIIVNEIEMKVTEKNFRPCVIGLVTEPERLYDLRKNRLNSLKEDQNSEYVNIDKIKDEVNLSLIHI